MTWKVINLAGSLGSYREDWDRLNAKLYGNQPFFDSRFIEPLLKFFATGNEKLCIHSRNGIVDGLLILISRRMGVWSLFAPSQAQIAPVLIENVTDVESLFKSLSGFPLMIEFQCQDPILTPFLININEKKIIFQPHSLTVSVSCSEKFSSYWSKRSKNIQKNYKRYTRRLQENNIKLGLSCCRTAEDMRAALTRYGKIESNGWKGKIGTAINENNAQGLFYSNVMENFAICKNAYVYELYLNEKIAASRLCISNKEMLIILKTTYDETLAKYAPGRLLLHALLEQAFSESHVKTIEFYTNANQDQIGWSTDQRTIQHVTFFRNLLLKKAYLVRGKLYRRCGAKNI